MVLTLASWVPDLANIAITFSSLGVLFHISILPFEIDTVILRFFALFAFVWTWLVTAFVRSFDMAVHVAILKASFAGVSFLGAVYTSMVVYRLFFHRLRQFPGPLGAKFSRFTVMSEVKKSGLKYHQELDKMHLQYGDFVRVGPRHIAINRASAVLALHGPQSPCTKSPFYNTTTGDKNRSNVIGFRDHDHHRRRRKIWDRALGMKAMADYLPRVQSKTDLLISKLNEHEGESLNVTLWTMFYSFDVMGLVTFSKDYQQLQKSAEHHAIAAMHAQMDMVAVFTPVPWLMYILSAIPFLKGMHQFLIYSTAQMNERRAEWRQNTTDKPTDIVSWLLQATEYGDPSAPPTDHAFFDEGRLAIIAGSDTTGAALTNAFYYLTSHPEAYKRLQKEVDEVRSRGSDTVQIPYLDAVINETLRLKPAVPGGLQRVTPPEGLTIDEVFIPGNTIVIAPTHVIQRDERNFERPLEFLPERWMEEGKHMHKDERAYFPFSIGHYSCVGKQLALTELRHTLQRIASEFDLEFAPGGSDERFDEGAKDTFTMSCPQLDIIFRKRDLSN